MFAFTFRSFAIAITVFYFGSSAEGFEASIKNYNGFNVRQKGPPSRSRLQMNLPGQMAKKVIVTGAGTNGLVPSSFTYCAHRIFAQFLELLISYSSTQLDAQDPLYSRC